MKKAIFVFLLLFPSMIFGQNSQKIEFNTNFSQTNLNKSSNLLYQLHFKKRGLYKISVLQQGIDVTLILKDNKNNTLIEKDSPNGINGLEQFEFRPSETANYTLTIKRLDKEGNPESGKVSIKVKEYTSSEIKELKKIKKELEPENKKMVQNIDIDHFWEAYDNLKKCKSRKDSITSFQKIYLNRATDGLKDFIDAREFTAEKFVDAVAMMPKFYNSIRKNTLKINDIVDDLNVLVINFKNIYPQFKEKKICFAIGIVNTGGTISDDFLLIGTEIAASNKNVDLSEFTNEAFRKVLEKGDDVTQKIKNMVAHEYVHTQQNTQISKNAIECNLLFSVIQEGMCDFIGELISGDQINKVAQEYGDAHEKELWIEFKNELCNQNDYNWLYNYESTKDRPADLGYYIGYQISKEYYNNMTDKKQAIYDILNMNDSIIFLQKSKYDQKEKQ